LVKIKEIAGKLNRESKLKTVRRSKRRKILEYKEAAVPIKGAEDSCRINCFLKVVDTSIVYFRRSFDMDDTR
jgi:hypothetical protein